MNPKKETKGEERTRHLKELEGKNISHYGVLLQTIIQSELDSVKTIITLSSVAIGLLFTVSRFKDSYEIIGAKIFNLSIYFFIVTIVLGLLFLNKASAKYRAELGNAKDMNDKQWDGLIETRKDFSIYRKATFITFVLGIVAGVAFGFF